MLLLSLAFAAEPPPMVNGLPTDAWPAVVTLMAVDDAGEGTNFCSGTLVAPGWVLTAAHCLVEMDTFRRTRTPNLVVVFGFDLGLTGGVQEILAAADTFIPATFDGVTFHDDIGLVQLATEVTDVEPIPLDPRPPTECDLGEALRYVGWGTVADDALDTTMKREADIPLHDFDDDFLYGYDPDDGQNPCAGDSGGAVLRDLGDGGFALAAVSSFVSDDDATPCAGGYAAGTRVDRQLRWIERHTPVTMVEAEAEACPGSRSGCSTVGGSGATLGVLLAGLGVRRRSGAGVISANAR